MLHPSASVFASLLSCATIAHNDPHQGGRNPAEALCTPLDDGSLFVLQAATVAPQPNQPADPPLLLGMARGEASGMVVFFYNGSIIDRGSLAADRLSTESPETWPHGEPVWGLGGKAMLPRLSEAARLDAPLLTYPLAHCDPSQFLTTASLDVEGDGVVDFQIGIRRCPQGEAFEVREQLDGSYRSAARWLTPWTDGEGPRECRNAHRSVGAR